MYKVGRGQNLSKLIHIFHTGSVRDPNSAHEMSELNYYNLQQSYTTELKNTINSHAIYIP